MKKLLRTALLRHFLQTIIIYVAVYLFKSFVYWELANPFKWIINMPTYDQIDRAMILIGVMLYYGLSIFVNLQILIDDDYETHS